MVSEPECEPREGGPSWLVVAVAAAVGSFRACPADPFGIASPGFPEMRDQGPDERLPREARLRRAADFRSVMAEGRRGVSQFVVAFFRRTPAGDADHHDSGPRLGVIASRKAGKANRRNRTRRQLREIWRRSASRPAGDLILLARPGIGEASWTGLNRSYRAAVARALGRGRRSK